MEKYLSKNLCLNLNYNVGELKKIIFEQINITYKYTYFYIDNFKLKNNQFLKIEILNKIIVKISKLYQDSLYLKYTNSKFKIINTDLYNTGIELLKQIKKIKYNDMKINYII